MYKLTHCAAIVRIADNASFLPEADNPNYQAYLIWRGEGNTPEPADPAPIMPAPVDPLAKLQAFLTSNPDVAALL